MPFTPDSELDLLFPAEYISQEIRAQLHPDLHVCTLSDDSDPMKLRRMECHVVTPSRVL